MDHVTSRRPFLNRCVVMTTHGQRSVARISCFLRLLAFVLGIHLESLLPLVLVMDSETFAPICWVKNPFHPVIDFQCSTCGQLPIACDEAGYALTYVNCEFGCGATYCCTQCRDTAVQHHHDMLCVGPYDECHPIYKLKVLALESGPQNFSTIHLAAMLACCRDDDTVVVDESCLDLTNQAFAGTYELVVQSYFETSTCYPNVTPMALYSSNCRRRKVEGSHINQNSP
jgi:hypothetical protein